MANMKLHTGAFFTDEVRWTAHPCSTPNARQKRTAGIGKGHGVSAPRGRFSDHDFQHWSSAITEACLVKSLDSGSRRGCFVVLDIGNCRHT